VFLVELGEYYPGDILALARLLEPDLSVVCPVGHQHLERMRSIETIAQTVLELAQYHKYHPAAVLLHESLVPFLPAGLSQPPLTYGVQPASDYAVLTAQVSWSGTDGQLQLTKTASPVTAFTPLFGAHQLVNSLPAIWLCTQLGLDATSAVRQLGDTPYIPHRHQPIFTQTNMLILDNGYNSNPDSAIQSLQLLQALPATARIVITPGFAELGDQAEQYHYHFGQQLAGVATYLGLIQSAGQTAIEKGFLQAGGKAEQIIKGPTQTAVAEQMAPLFKAQSVLLFENNLPEVYN
jgi:UDP-N-acetylmuramoyl-tripeptide--D-alanyl-D-alanine ligase